jgi:hypothetical protein
VVDAAIAEHLEILGLTPLRRLRVVEGISHRDALIGLLLDAVDEERLRDAGDLQDRRRDIDHVVELAAYLFFRLDSTWPVDDRAGAGAAPVGSDLLGPLIRRIHRMRPPNGVVVVRRRSAELVDLGLQVRWRLNASNAVKDEHLVEGAVDGALGAGAVVPDDVVDQGVLHHTQVF